ncbi:MAG: hypothetical protein ACI9BW_002510 [Gammaproteobacteria bacterium]|jgi:hypothetical protein
MRLWSIHPRYLDAKGLVALWRQGLLAQKVLRGDTKGYMHHPQLNRFKELPYPVAAIRKYLHHVHQEALARNYNFDQSKIGVSRSKARIDVNTGQIAYETEHLLCKLKKRDPVRYAGFVRCARFQAHPMFDVINGPIADWEIL